MNDPAIPISMVMMHPPGSRPGMRSFATAPMSNPITNVQIRAPMILILQALRTNRAAMALWSRVSLQLNHLRRFYVVAAPDLFEQRVIGNRVEIQDGQRRAARLV